MSREPNLPPVYRLIAMDTVDSTNDEAKRLAVKGAEDGTLVWARRQTAARGRRGRAWVSLEGNLHCSLILRPECSAETALQLGFVAALAVYDAIGSVVDGARTVHCKWPNDIIMRDAKVAGILLEAEATGDAPPDWVVLGLGINLAHYPEDTEYPATSLKEEGSPHVTEVDMLEAFGRHFLVWTNRWLDDGFAPVREQWLKRAAGLGAAIEVRLDDETLSGTFADLDTDGALLLVQDGTERRITSGDVFPAAG